MKHLMLLFAALFAFVAPAGEIQDRFLYVACGLSGDRQIDETIALVRRAARQGFNGVVLQGDIQYAWLASAHDLRNLARLKAACDEVGMDLIPAIWSIGYGAMLWANPNLAAGLPVFDVPYEVSSDGSQAVFCPSSDTLVSNGDFEEVVPAKDGKGFKVPGWFVETPGEICFVDREVRASGKQSLRFELSVSGKRKDPQARACQVVKVRPNSRYRVTARLKTEGLDATYGFQIVIYTKPGKGETAGMTRQLTCNRPRIETTNDWTDMTAEISTLDYDELYVYLGSWQAREGRFWLDDVKVTELGIDKLLRRPGCPLTVRNATTGATYKEGRDFAPVPPLRNGAEKQPSMNGSVVFAIPPGSRMKPGTKLLISGYAPHRMKSDSQVSVCMSEPELYELFGKSAAAIEAAIHPRKWFLPLDEIRAGGTCAACRARNTDMAHIFGDCVTKMRKAIKRVSPKATIYMWGDQLDPKMNARDGVYMCRGTFAGSVDLVPKDIVVMHWGGALAETLEFFHAKGFRTARSRAIDGKWINGVPASVTDDYRIAKEAAGCRGFMYTTWRRDYSLEKLEAFGRLVAGEAAAPSSDGSITVSAGTCAVVVGAAAPSPVQFAAEELAGFLTRRFGGKKVPVRPAPVAGEFAFVLGTNAWSRSAGLFPERLPRDAFAVKLDLPAKRLYIAGCDDPSVNFRAKLRIGVLNFERATLFGVYDFLERFADCRFYFPGELGEIVPRADVLTLRDGLDYTSAPHYTVRRTYDGPSQYFEPADGRNPLALNRIRTRMETLTIPCCHGLNAFCFLRRFAKTHPEYFALYQGVRQTDPRIKHPGQICWSSGITEEIYRDARAYLLGESAESRGVPTMNGKGFSWNYNCSGGMYVDVMPQDSMVACQCEGCSQSRAHAADPVHNATELVWGHVVDWANRLKREGIKGNLTMMSYPPYAAVPAFDIPDNVQVMVAVTGPFSIANPAKRAKDTARVKAWADKLGHKVWLWTYPNKVASLELPGVPQFSMHAWAEYYLSMKPLVFGAFAESESDRWFYNHLNHYVFGRVMWDEHANVDQILAEYAERMFGKGTAAERMGEFIKILEDKWTYEIVGRSYDTPLGPVTEPPSDADLWGRVYSEEVLARLDRLLTEASAAAADPLASRRVALYRSEIYDRLKAASSRYLDHKRAVGRLEVLKGGRAVRLRPWIQPRDAKDLAGLAGLDLAADASVTLTGDALKFHLDCAEPRVADVLAIARKPDDRLLWQDNGIELFFNPSGDRAVFYQLIVNSEGSYADIRREVKGQTASCDNSWDAHADIKIEKKADRIVYDVSIPLSAIPEKIVSPMPVNMCRSRALKAGGRYQQYFMSSPLAAEYGDLPSFSSVDFR